MLHRAFATAALLCLSTTVAASQDFFQTRNDALIVGAVSLPALAPAAPAEGQLDFGARIDIVSEFVAIDNANESLLMDGETYRLSLSTSGRFSERSFWSVRLPVLHQGGGFMDSIINDWHDFFGLPEGGRDQAPKDRYRYEYVRDGQTELLVTDGGNRLGDLEIAWHFLPSANWLLGAQLKLPTGNDEKLAGGGTTGGSLWVTHTFQTGRFGGFISAGASANGRGGILREQQRRVTPFGGFGLNVRLTEWMTAVTQLYAHRAPFTGSNLSALERDSAQLSLGAVFRLGPVARLHLLFQEDVAVNASPDFSMQAAIYW